MTRSLLLVAAVLASALTAQAAAAYPRETQTLSVSTRGVDLDNRADAARFYQRLKFAASTVCDSRMADLGARLSDQRCAKDALDRAVHDVNAPLVTAMHTGADATQYASNGR
jgi:UrcA family protein